MLLSRVSYCVLIICNISFKTTLHLFEQRATMGDIDSCEDYWRSKVNMHCIFGKQYCTHCMLQITIHAHMFLWVLQEHLCLTWLPILVRFTSSREKHMLFNVMLHNWKDCYVPSSDTACVLEMTCIFKRLFLPVLLPSEACTPVHI